jgi:hypothetical protein
MCDVLLMLMLTSMLTLMLSAETKASQRYRYEEDGRLSRKRMARVLIDGRGKILSNAVGRIKQRGGECC